MDLHLSISNGFLTALFHPKFMINVMTLNLIKLTSFFDLIFKYVNNMKTFVCDYHMNDPTTFLHHQIQVCHAHARMLALGHKNAFSVLHVHGLVIFQDRAQI